MTVNKRVDIWVSSVTVLGFLLAPILWLILKYGVGISDRYLPAPAAVLGAFQDIDPSVWIHFAYTAVRLILGLFAGVVVGIALGIGAYRSKTFNKLLMPTMQSMRSVPAVAIVPFFLLWFGFSESGRIILVVSGIAFNIAVAAYQSLAEVPERYRIMFHSFGIKPGSMMADYSIPTLQENLLPTIRFSLSTAMGVVIVSELLGSQIGLGYLMQTARSTFSMHVIFLAAILLGILNTVVDACLTWGWQKMVYWRK